MKDANEKKTSKFLSYILRHHPDAIGIKLDENGWADTEDLLSKLRLQNVSLSLDQLKSIVKNNDKQRFSFSDDFQKIRANQGHSLQVDLQLSPQAPPDQLYHGTAVQNIGSIKQSGLLKGSRHHVHLSADQETAKKVGMRYGKPVVLTVQAKRMWDEGQFFYLSDNGVWLTESVLPAYIIFPA